MAYVRIRKAPHTPLPSRTVNIPPPMDTISTTLSRLRMNATLKAAAARASCVLHSVCAAGQGLVVSMLRHLHRGHRASLTCTRNFLNVTPAHDRRNLDWCCAVTCRMASRCTNPPLRAPARCAGRLRDPGRCRTNPRLAGCGVTYKCGCAAGVCGLTLPSSLPLPRLDGVTGVGAPMPPVSLLALLTRAMPVGAAQARYQHVTPRRAWRCQQQTSGNGGRGKPVTGAASSCQRVNMAPSCSVLGWFEPRFAAVQVVK